MPLQQIDVKSQQGNRSRDKQGSGGQEYTHEEMDTNNTSIYIEKTEESDTEDKQPIEEMVSETSNGGKGETMVAGDNSLVIRDQENSQTVICICDTNNTESANANNEALTDSSVDLDDMASTPHVEADTVILGSTNSQSPSYDSNRQTDNATGTEANAAPLNVTSDVSSNVTTTDKHTNTRNKASKKEKPTPVRKKDSETQETLHPNSPTPISAERCDSSLSNMDACRICQCDSCEIQKDSPLVCPCLCSGSLKFVHQACLQKWIKSSDKLSCELCHFEYQMTKKTKPFSEWERLDMTAQERRKVVCSVTFHVIAITCVVWSLYVLIDRTTEEVQAGSLLWPFWTKLIVVAIGFTGGVVFMYVQCKMYLTLCKKWRMYNKVILISSISDSQRVRANHEGILRINEKQAALEEGRLTNFDVFTIVQETESV